LAPTNTINAQVTKRILGIDPGTNILGFAVIEVDRDHVQVLEIGVIKLKDKEAQSEKLREIYLEVQEIIERYLPGDLAIEAPFYGKNVQSMLKLGRAQGVAIAAGITMGLNITEYSPKKIKQSVTGNGNAAKEQVSDMLCRMLNLKPENVTLDATDALSVALCHHYQHGRPASSKGNSWKKFLSENPGRAKG
jgi:crossover junction endodeoxyribonuclease RuvC